VGSNLLGAMCIFLVLARRRLYVGMEIGFAGRGDENDRYRMVAEHGNGLCAWRRKSERQNTKWAEQTVRGEEEIGMAEHEMGRTDENDRYRMVAEHGNGLCVGRRKSERQNTKWAEGRTDCARGGENRKGRTRNGQNRE
jgi:hypothetical protein